MLSMLVVLVVLWSGSVVYAQGKGKGAGKKDEQSSKVQNKGKSAEKKETVKKEVAQGDSEAKVEKAKKQAGSAKAKDKALEGAAKGKSTENIGKGKGRQQQSNALKKQMLHEQAKHRKRLAHFNRIRELAAKKGDTAILERLKVLEEKEQGRYDGKRKRMMEMMLKLETGESETVKKTVEKKAAEKGEKVETEAKETKEAAEAKEAEETKEAAETKQTEETDEGRRERMGSRRRAAEKETEE